MFASRFQSRLLLVLHRNSVGRDFDVAFVFEIITVYKDAQRSNHIKLVDMAFDDEDITVLEVGVNTARNRRKEPEILRGLQNHDVCKARTRPCIWIAAR